MTVTNRAPEAVNDAATTPSGSAVPVPVLGNDSDPEHAPLTVTAVTNGTNGTVTMNADGTVTYTPNPDFHGTDTFTYTVNDGQGGTSTATVSVTVIQPVLNLAKSVDKLVAGPGDVLTYTISYSNSGNAAASNVTIADALPAHTTLVSASDGGTLANGTVTWAIGAVAAGAGSSVTVTVQLDAVFPNGTTAVSNSASVTSTETPTPTSSNATDTTVTAAPTLALTKTSLTTTRTDLSISNAVTASSPQVARVDSAPAVATDSRLSTITYRLVVSNSGNAAATQVVIKDVLPPTVNFVSATAGGAYDSVSRTVTWSVASLAPGSSQTVDLVVGIQ